MEPLTVALGVLSLGLAAACVWLFVARAGLIAGQAGFEARVEKLEQDVQAAKGELERERASGRVQLENLTRQIDEFRMEAVAHAGECTRLTAELDGERKLWQQRLQDGTAAAERAQQHARERFDDEVKSLRNNFGEKEASLRRELNAIVTGEREKIAAERRVLTEELQKREVDLKTIAEQSRVTFADVAAQVVSKSQHEFMQMAQAKLAAHDEVMKADMDRRRGAVEELVKPIGESLKKTELKLSEIEKERSETFGRLSEQIRGVTETSSALREQAVRLVNSLKRSEIRGRYGEVQLERVVELAGMTAWSDFNKQHSTRDGEGNLLRPDLVITMASRREIVVDAKANLLAYVEAIDAPDAESRDSCFARFAGHIAQQIEALARKQYWSQYRGSPEFVVMFIPGDQFLDAALRVKPNLIETAAESGIIIATPSSLIGLLKVVALGWREKRLDDQARELFKLGSELHDRAAVAWSHLSDVGASLSRSVEAYNKAVRSVETRLTPTLRKFEEAGARSPKEIDELAEISVRPHHHQRAAFAAGSQNSLLPDSLASDIDDDRLGREG